MRDNSIEIITTVLLKRVLHAILQIVIFVYIEYRYDIYSIVLKNKIDRLTL